MARDNSERTPSPGPSTPRPTGRNLRPLLPRPVDPPSLGPSIDPNPTRRPTGRNLRPLLPRPVDPRTLPPPSTPPNRPLPLRPDEQDPTPTMETVTQPSITTVQPPPNLKARIKESYDAIASDYDRWTLRHRNRRLNYATRFIQLLAEASERRLKEAKAARRQQAQPREQERNGTPHINPLKGKHALDVGCGSGIPVVEVLLSEDMDVTGADISSMQIAMAKNHFPNSTSKSRIAWVEGDMMDLRYPPGMFDAIVAVYSLVHLPREEQTVFLHRMVMWLKPGGMMMVNFSQEELEGLVVDHWLRHEKGWMYWSGWGEEKTMQIIEGFEDMEVLFKEVTEQNDPQDATFVWVIAKKKEDAVIPALPEAAEAVEA